jgi:hypothetical protein
MYIATTFQISDLCYQCRLTPSESLWKVALMNPLNHFYISSELKKLLCKTLSSFRNIFIETWWKNVTDHESMLKSDWSANRTIKFEPTFIPYNLLCPMAKISCLYLLSFSSYWENRHTHGLFRWDTYCSAPTI